MKLVFLYKRHYNFRESDMYSSAKDFNQLKKVSKKTKFYNLPEIKQ